jgi:GT2 family glycosyltransferase
MDFHEMKKESIELVTIVNSFQPTRKTISLSFKLIVNTFPFTHKEIVTGDNLGFGGAVNMGIRSSHAFAKADGLIVLLNDDTEVTKNWLYELVQMQQHTGSDMVASNIYLAGKSTHDSAGFGYAWRGKAAALHPTADGKLVCTLSHEPDFEHTGIEPYGPDAAACLYTQKLFTKIGLFDESLFMYLEDVELAVRARTAGLHCAFADKAFVYHHKHATTEKLQKRWKAKQDMMNWWKIIVKHYSWKRWRKFGLYILIERMRNVKGWLFA